MVALVGYTNAGKSTFFNRLTGSDVMAEDMLFATLDPTMREIRLPGERAQAGELRDLDVNQIVPSGGWIVEDLEGP